MAKENGEFADMPVVVTVLFVVLVLALLFVRWLDSYVQDQMLPTEIATSQIVSVPTRTPRPTATVKPTQRPTATAERIVAVSWIDLQRFLSADHTNWNRWVEGVYMCRDFACDLLRNARAKGLRSGIVLVDFEDDFGHSIVRFETTDKGWVWIEPQSDYAYVPTTPNHRLCYVVDRTVCEFGRIIRVWQNDSLTRTEEEEKCLLASGK